jgi:hypothetical protein
VIFHESNQPKQQSKYIDFPLNSVHNKNKLEMLLHILYDRYYFEEIFENNQMKIHILEREIFLNVDYYI